MKRKYKDVDKYKSIMQNFDYYNEEVIGEGWKRDRQCFQRIEINLADKNFFLPFVSGSLKLEPKSLEQCKGAPEIAVRQPCDDKTSLVDTQISAEKTQVGNISQANLNAIQQPPLSKRQASDGVSVVSLGKILQPNDEQQELREGGAGENPSIKVFIDDYSKNLTADESKLSHSTVATNF